MKGRWVWLVGAIVVVGVGLGLYLGGVFHGGESGLEAVSVRLDWLAQAQFAGVYVAADKGYFTDEKLAITINPGGVDLNPIRLVASGSDTFGMANADQVLVARSQGLPLVAVAALYQQNPVVFISLADSGIRKAADFAGHSVGVKIGTSPDILYQALMKKVGVDRTSIREIPVQFDMSTFFSGQVQVWPAYIINEAIIAKDQGFAVNIINPFDYGIYDYADVVFTTEEFLKEHPDTVRSFLKALLKGWKDSVADQSMAVQTLLRMNDGLEAGHETKMMAAVVPLVTAGIGARIGWMDAAKWQATYDMLNQQGLLEEPFAVASAYTLEHIQAIYK